MHIESEYSAKITRNVGIQNTLYFYTILSMLITGIFNLQYIRANSSIWMWIWINFYLLCISIPIFIVNYLSINHYHHYGGSDTGEYNTFGLFLYFILTGTTIELLMREYTGDIVYQYFILVRYTVIALVLTILFVIFFSLWNNIRKPIRKYDRQNDIPVEPPV